MRVCSLIFATVSVVSLLAENGRGEFRFRHHYGDRELEGNAMGQTALVDVDRDGDLDFVTGQRGGQVYWYEYQAPDRWLKHVLGERSPAEVGGVAMDVDRDEWTDFVVGGAWYQNSRKPKETPFVRHVFDAELAAVHDVAKGDVDGDGALDVITMSDRSDVRWYKIPQNPAEPWKHTRIGESVHAGLSVGDLDGDGDLDLVRSNVWFENIERGQKWIEHRMTEPWGGKERPWEVNATKTWPIDINGDGRLDVVVAESENRGARIAWVEAPPDPKAGPWKIHFLPKEDEASRGAYHSLVVADFDGDKDPDIFTVEMEAVPGDRPPRWFIWENVDGKGRFVERVILDANLGGHEAVAGDVDGDGDLDICSKLWRPSPKNANRGRNHFDYLENLAR